jgi:SNF2 family DNA or RNA helicase
MIHISHRTRSIVVPYDDRIGALLTHGTVFEHGGVKLVAIPHGLDETRMLRNFGLPVPSPIAEHYNFFSADGHRPFSKQVLTSSMMVMNPRAYVLNDMGTGKTKSCIWAFDWLQSMGLAKRMLVVGTVSTLNFTWAREIFHTFPHKQVRVLTGTAARRKKLLAEEADIYIINHDGVKVVAKELAMRRDIDVICFDEAAAYRNARAERSKIAKQLTLGRRFVWGMTGSPTPSAPTDAFGLARLITPDTAPRSFRDFRTQTMVQVSQWKWVPRNDAAETVSMLLQPSIRISLDEIVELPPVIIRDQLVPMGVRQQKTYDALKEHASALLKEGTITAANGGVVFSKMLQASLGWVYADRDREIIALDNQGRLDALLDLVESADRKVIIFSPFKSATAGIATLLEKEKIDFATVTGDTSQRDRADIFQAFQNTSKYRVLNAHPECMSHGLTLTAADTIIWFGPVTKLETYEQANARITRVGQLHKQQIIRMVGTPAERALYKRLEGKQTMQDNILDIIKELTTGDQ